jgi:NhaP-type Na+/H+ or K+/H+ antiporter
MVSFLFGILIGMVMGYGMYTITDKIDKQIRENNGR